MRSGASPKSNPLLHYSWLHHTMHITIAKVDETYFDGEAESLTVPGMDGELTIMGNHMPLITTLKEGTLVLRTADGVKGFPIKNGVLEVRAEGATVLL